MAAARIGWGLVVAVALVSGCSILSGTSEDEPDTPVATVGVTAPAQALKDLRYAELSGTQRLDLYLPKRTGTAVPLVINIHGGGFFAGSRSEMTFNVRALQAAGFAVATVDYRLTGEARFPAAVQDVKAAVRWLRVKAPSYGIDPGAFGAWGVSAGGYLAAMLGTTAGVDGPLAGAELGNPDTSDAVQAVVDWFGPTDFLTMNQQAAREAAEFAASGAGGTASGTRRGCPGTPLDHDGPGSPESRWLGAPVQSAPDLARSAGPMTRLSEGRKLPPFFIAHGGQDCTVPYGQSEQLAGALRRVSGSAQLTIVPGAGHDSRVLAATQLTPSVAFLAATLRSGR